MRAEDVAAARELAARVHLVSKPVGGPAEPRPAIAADSGPGAQIAPMPRLVADALSARRVLRIHYGDWAGASTVREIEPLGFVERSAHWYLVGWCRLRLAVRAFRTDRIRAVTMLAEVPSPRPLRHEDLDIPPEFLHGLTLG
jgi:predicted DNA-binding transcriptional regulator YafY